MAEKSSGGSSSRSGTPLLWGSASSSSGLTFNAPDVPNLLLPFATSSHQPIVGDDEVDHFIGQDSASANFTAPLPSGGPPLHHSHHPPQSVTPGPPSVFDQSHASDFVVGFGAAPRAVSPPAQSSSAIGLLPQPATSPQQQASPLMMAALRTPASAATYSSFQQQAVGPGFLANNPAAPPMGIQSTAAHPAAPMADHDYVSGVPASVLGGVAPDGSSYRQPLDRLAAAWNPGPFVAPPSGSTWGGVRSLPPPPTQGLDRSYSATGPAAAMSTPSPLPPTAAYLYKPVQHHWFYRRTVDGKTIWMPFSRVDSAALESRVQGGAGTMVSTDGGRYDVDLAARKRHAVYWADEEATDVRRCSWFYKDEIDHRFHPYDEDFAARLEDEYRNAVCYNIWHRRLEFPDGETIVMHNPGVVVHFRATSQPDEWGTSQQGDQARPLVVKRGAEDVDTIPAGEPLGVDHLVFVVQGIGPVCDLRFRNLAECVDDIRRTAQAMLESHYKIKVEQGRVAGRIEFLPVRWHEALRSDATAGVDCRLRAITPDGVRKLRQFSNETLLDILFYTSPFYSQKIVDQVASEMNRMYSLFLQRNPTFCGEASVAGHSLGSLILFDLLSHQDNAEASGQAGKSVTPPGADVVSHGVPVISLPVETDVSPPVSKNTSDAVTIESALAKLGLGEFAPKFHQERIDLDSLMLFEDDDLKELGLPLGPRKKLKAYLLEERKLKLEEGSRQQAKVVTAPSVSPPSTLQTASLSSTDYSRVLSGGSPAVSGSSGVSSTSVAYESGLGGGVGRPACSYPQLDFRPTSFYALGSPIAMFLTVRGVGSLGADYCLPTCERFFNIFHPFDPVAYRMEPLISPTCTAKPVLVPHHKGRKRLHLELKESLSRVGSDLKQKIVQSLRSTWNTIHDFALAHRTAVAPHAMSQSALAADESLGADHNDLDHEFVEAMASIGDEVDESFPNSAAGNYDDYINIGQLNQGRRLDYVLQEGPLESFNEYLFSLASHVCYWESEDTALMIVREVYSAMDVQPDERSVTAGSASDSTSAASPSHLQYVPAVATSFPGNTPASQRKAPGTVSSALPVSTTALFDSLSPLFGARAAASAPLPGPYLDPHGPPPMAGFIAKK